MPAKRGSTLLVKRGDAASPEVFTTFASIRNATLTINGQPINVTTGDDVDGNNEIWNTYITGPKDLSVSGEGIAKSLGQPQSVYQDFAAGTITNYQIVVPYIGTFTLAMIVGNMEFTGQYDDAVTFNLTLQGNEAPTFVAES